MWVTYNMWLTVEYVGYCRVCGLLYNMWVTVQYVGYCTVCGLLYSMSCCLTAICFMSFALCNVLINCFCFLITRFIFAFSFCLPFFVFCVCNVLCIVSPHVYGCYLLSVYNCTDRCHRAQNRQQLIKTNITSNHTQPVC
jgi:hypothetical protein